MNASNPRTALTTSASRLLALLTGEQKAAGCAPGQAVLGCCLSPVGYQAPDYLLVDGIHPELADPGFVRQYLGVSLTRKGAAFLHALQTLAAAKGVDLSFSLVYQGREEPLAELSPQHQYCCRTSASGPLCRPGCRSAATLPGAEAPVSSLSSFFTPFSVPLSGKSTLARSPRWVSCSVCRGKKEGPGRRRHRPGPRLLPCRPRRQRGLAFPDGPAILQSFFPLIHFPPFFFDIFCIPLLILQPI